MTLLAPVSAAVAGAIAGACLLLLYVLKLRRRRLRVSSTMLWEQAADDLLANEPFRRLRVSLLLLIQALALACLVLAIGRPALPSAAVRSDTVLVMIDTSASMRATDGTGGVTRLDEAKERAIELIDGLPRGSAVQVGTVAAEAELLTPMSTDHGAARRAVREIEPTDQPSSMDAAADLAAAVLSGTGEEPGADTDATLVIITDGGGPPGRALFGGGSPKLIRVGPEPGAPLDNLGIVAATIGRDYDDPSSLKLFLRVQQTPGPARPVVIETELDGAVVDRRTIELPAATDAPASATTTIDIQPGEASLLRARIVTEDALAADNEAVLVLPETDPTGVLLVTPSGGGPDAAAEDPVYWVVADVLAALGDTELETTDPRGLSVRLSEENGFAGIDLVVLDRVGLPGRVPRNTLSFGVALPGSALERADQDGPGDVFINWQRGHAAMRGLTFDSVRIADRAWFETETDAALRMLARGRSGPIVAMVDDGRLRRIGVSFEPARSTWPLDPSFTLFIAQAVELLTAETGPAASASVKAGQTPTMLLKAGGQTVMQGPEDLTGRPIGEAIDGQIRVAFAAPRLAGLYQHVDSGARLAVNVLDPAESALRVSDEIVFSGRPLSAADGRSGLREVWPWFVLASLVLLTAEWAWYVRRSRGV